MILHSAPGIARSTCHLCILHAHIMSTPHITTDYDASCSVYNTAQHSAAHCNILQHTAERCRILQHTATHYNAPQYTTRTADAVCRCNKTMSIRHKTLSTCHNTTQYHTPQPASLPPSISPSPPVRGQEQHTKLPPVASSFVSCFV